MGSDDIANTIKDKLMQRQHITKLEGKTLAVDVSKYVRLGVISDAAAIAAGARTNRYLLRIQNLLSMASTYKVVLWFVFDGMHLPAKNATREKRNKARQANLDKLASLFERARDEDVDLDDLRASNVTVHNLERQTVTHTPAIEGEFMAFLDAHGAKYTVAPYEAIPQMVLLEMLGHVDGVMSDDTDVFAYGAKYVVMDLDRVGTCYIAEAHDCYSSFGLGVEDLDHYILFIVLAGNDYSDGADQIEIRKVSGLINTVEAQLGRLPTIEDLKERYPQHFPENRLRTIRIAELVFRHQTVWDVDAKVLRRLNPFNETSEPPDIVRNLGPFVHPAVAAKVVTGELNPQDLNSRRQQHNEGVHYELNQSVDAFIAQLSCLSHDEMQQTARFLQQKPGWEAFVTLLGQRLSSSNDPTPFSSSHS